MRNFKSSRREALKTGLAAFAAGAAISPEAFAAPKIPGETRVLLLVGDYWHNGAAALRAIQPVCDSGSDFKSRPVHIGAV